MCLVMIQYLNRTMFKQQNLPSFLGDFIGNKSASTSNPGGSASGQAGSKTSVYLDEDNLILKGDMNASGTVVRTQRLSSAHGVGEFYIGFTVEEGLVEYELEWTCGLSQVWLWSAIPGGTQYYVLVGNANPLIGVEHCNGTWGLLPPGTYGFRVRAAGGSSDNYYSNISNPREGSFEMRLSPY